MIGDVPVRNMIVTSSFSYAYVTAAPLHSLWEGEGGVNSLQGTPSFFFCKLYVLKMSLFVLSIL